MTAAASPAGERPTAVPGRGDSPAPAGPPERIRVAALMDTAIVSGPGRQLAAVAPALRARGVDLRVVVFQHTARERTAYREFLERAGVDHVVVPFRSRFDRRLLPALRRTLDAWDPHLVQTHSYRPTALAWLLRRGGARWGWIGFFHGTTNEDLKVRVYHWLDRRLLPAADRIVVMSQLQAASFGGAGGPVRQIYNAVIPVPDVAGGEQIARVAALPRPRVGVVGRLSAEKGVDVLLRAVRLLRDAGRSLTLVVAGDGPERGACETLAGSLGVAEDVTFLGPVLPVEPLYPELDLVVIPSRSEGLPNVLLEAFRADRPVVSTAVGAVPEVVAGTVAARIVPPENPAALADAIGAALDTLDDPAARAARADVARRFSLEQRVAAHVQLYAEVLGERARRA